MDVSKSRFGRELELSRSRVSQLLHLGMPIGADGKVPLEKARAWYEATVRKGARKRGPSKGGPPSGSRTATAERLLRAQARDREHMAELREIRVRERRGELLEKAEVERVWSRSLTGFRNRALLLVDKLAPRVAVVDDVLECRVLIEREVREMLSALADYEEEGEKSQTHGRDKEAS